MFKNIDVEQVIKDNLITSASCHVYICEDTQKAFRLALRYGKYIRSHIVREKRDKRRGFWKLYLQDGNKYVFCSEEYYLNSPVQCSCLGFAG